MSIRFRLMLYFLALLLIPILTMGILGPIFYARSIERQTMDHTIAMIGQVTANIEARVEEVERLIDLLAATPEVSAFFASGTGLAERNKDSVRMMGDVTSTHPDIAGILLVNRRDGWASEDFYRITRDPLTEEPWYREASQHPQQVRLVPRPFGRNIRSTMGYGADEVVSVTKSIVDPRDGSVLGVVLVDMKLSVIEQVFSFAALGKNGFLFIADPKGEMVYAPVNDVVYRVPLSSLEGDSSSAFVRIGGIDYQVVAKRSSYTGWRTLGVFSVNEALREVLAVRYLSFFIGCITAILAVLAAFFFTSSIARPVLSLRSLMKRAEEGDLSVRCVLDSGDEIGELGHGLNEMLDRIQDLIGQVYREQKAKREAELGILQEQIKPHFLYNTLDTIQWMAQEHRVDDVVCMVEALSSLFRIGLNKGRELIDLADELEHVESYLCIQKMRYEDKFDFEIRSGEGLGHHQVLRLILQPLVENAIYHGIKERRGNGHLLVEVSEAGGELLLIVRDDGVGMAEERLAGLNIALESLDFGPEGLGKGYGIRNVHERIVLTFGQPFGLRFARGPGGGTEARIRHPLLDAEGE